MLKAKDLFLTINAEHKGIILEQINSSHETKQKANFAAVFAGVSLLLDSYFRGKSIFS